MKSRYEFLLDVGWVYVSTLSPRAKTLSKLENRRVQSLENIQFAPICGIRLKNEGWHLYNFGKKGLLVSRSPLLNLESKAYIITSHSLVTYYTHGRS